MKECEFSLHDINERVLCQRKVDVPFDNDGYFSEDDIDDGCRELLEREDLLCNMLAVTAKIDYGDDTHIYSHPCLSEGIDDSFLNQYGV